jgi:flagellar biosynthesis/type III secretory pathway protein FliH
MTITRGRLLRVADQASTPTSLDTPTPAPLPRGRRVARAVVDAEHRAAEIIANAEERGRTLLDAAARSAGDVRLKAEAEGRAEGVAQVAAHAVRLAALESQSDERALARTIDVARLLAERLLGEALRVDETRIVALARVALGEARGARRVVIVANPDDARVLESSREGLGMPPEAIAIAIDDQRARGDLRIETEIGVLDAALAPQLDRLALKLRESVKK